MDRLIGWFGDWLSSNSISMSYLVAEEASLHAPHERKEEGAEDAAALRDGTDKRIEGLGSRA
jgi:hypothetical protein